MRSSRPSASAPAAEDDARRLIRALLCDLDCVLIDSRAPHERVWTRWAQRHGLDVAVVIERAHGRPSMEAIAEFAPGLDAPAEADRLEREQTEDVAGVVAIPGAAQLLAAAPTDALAIVTSATADLAAARLAAAGLPLPPVVFTQERIARGKPDPEGYLAAAAALAVEPAACAVLEDAPAGVAAGRAAGAFVVGVLTTHAPDQLRGADVLVGDLRRLPGALGAPAPPWLPTI